MIQSGLILRLGKRVGTTVRCVVSAFVGVLALGTSAANELAALENCVLIATDWADGDSFQVRSTDGNVFTVRLYGADCIEASVSDESDERRLRDQRSYFGITKVKGGGLGSIKLAKEFGKAAAEEVRRCLSRPFTVHTAYADARGDGKHKRYYAFVFFDGNTDLAAHLVSSGLARAFGVGRQTWDGRSQADYKQYLQDLELVAARNAKGVWAETDWLSLPAERQALRDEDREIRLALDDRKLGDDESLDVNTASRDELMRLPGIGEGMANRIIEGRPYQSAEDLLRVDGIGPATLGKLRPFLQEM